jgi:hypothetical protein
VIESSAIVAQRGATAVTWAGRIPQRSGRRRGREGDLGRHGVRRLPDVESARPDPELLRGRVSGDRGIERRELGLEAEPGDPLLAERAIEPVRLLGLLHHSPLIRLQAIPQLLDPQEPGRIGDGGERVGPERDRGQRSPHPSELPPVPGDGAPEHQPTDRDRHRDPAQFAQLFHVELLYPRSSVTTTSK